MTHFEVAWETIRRKIAKKILMKPHTHFFLITLIILISISGCNNSSTKSTTKSVSVDDYSDRIDSLISTSDPRFFNGVILITQGGETKYEREYGYSDFENQVPISIHDQFRIMSNSKQITAVLILKEVEKGNVDLEAAISGYLPELTQTWADSVTVKHLLNMSSGISALDKPLLFEPGNGYYYSNPGYGLLGRILAKTTGKPYADNANSLFRELGMKNSSCYEIDGINEGLINSYALRKGETEVVDFSKFGFDRNSWSDFTPAGGIISDAHDLNIWDSKLHKEGLLNSSSYQQMIQPSNFGPHAVFDCDTIGYGYGIRVHDKHLVKHLGHGGRGFGFVSVKLHIPEHDVNVIVWENIYQMDNFPSNADIIYHFENEIRKIVLSSSLVE